jgi:hypothetical protein
VTHSANPIQIQKFLEGVDYPADRAALLAAAHEHQADDNVLRAIEAVPDRTYAMPTEVSQAIVEAGRRHD